MEIADDVDALLWAFSAPPEEGVASLEEFAAKIALMDNCPFDDLAGAEAAALTWSMDTREVMSALVSANGSFASPAQLALYVLILSRTYTALFVDTVARKMRLQRAKEMSTTEDSRAYPPNSIEMQGVLAAASSTMRAWSRDVTTVLTHSVLPQLCLQDAQPRTLSTSQQLTSAVPPVVAAMNIRETGSEADPSQPSEEGEETKEQQQQQQRLIKAIHDYHVPLALTRLVEAVYRTTHDDTVVPLVLSVYGALYQMEAFTAVLASSAVAQESVLQRWWRRFLREVADTPKGSVRKGSAAVTAVAAESPASCTTMSPVEAAVVRLYSWLREEVVKNTHMGGATGVWSFALTHLNCDPFPKRSGSSLFSTDAECGTAPPNTTAALLARERDEDVDAVTLVATDGVDDVQEGTSTADASCDASLSSALSRQGALFLLADTLRDPSVHRTALYTVSSGSLLLSVADTYAVALTCTSCAGLMRHLLLLHDILASTPKYSVECAGESLRREQHLLSSSPLSSARPMRESDGVVEGITTVFDSCSTRRYEALFAVEKGLLAVSALCPSDEHRRAARVVALELLERLKEEPRVRMHLSLLTLCPYPSIARFFLERLLQDWREQDSDSPQNCGGLSAESSAPLACMVPVGLGECMATFLRQLVSGTRGFLDPLIVALNFVRVEASRHSWIQTLGQQPVKPPLWKDRCASHAWAQLFSMMRRYVLPRCSAFAAPPTAPAAAPFALPSLSPLDAFSLSCAVDGVKTVLAVAELTGDS